jgi:assimilatory nitrate reductase catalytic subunit
VITRWGSVVGRLRTSGQMTRGTVFVPIHWSAANSSDARAGALVNPVVDPVSGEPEFKHTPTRVEPMPVEWHGVFYARGEADAPNVTWWTRVRGEGFFRYELAGRDKLLDRSPGARGQREAWARSLLGTSSGRGHFLDYEDTARGVYRAAYIENDRLVACVFVATRPDLPPREWLNDLLTKTKLDDMDRRALLAGRPLAAAANAGPVVCSCFRVGRNTIAEAVQCHGLKTAADVGALLKAGTNCGSCLPEIKALIATATAAA